MKVLSRENGVKLKVRGIVKELGGMVATFATSGWPDILAVFPGGKVLFIEVKKDQQRGYKEQNNQKAVRTILTQKGHSSIVLDGRSNIEYVIKETLKNV